MIPTQSTSGNTAFTGAKFATLSSDPTFTTMMVNQLSTLYGDPLYAVIREYTTNAIDAHKMYQIDQPIEINTGTEENPGITITSFVGLNKEQIESLILTYGNSAKRESNTAAGMLGYGAKSGLALVPEVHFTSIKDGQLYLAALTRDDEGIKAFVTEGSATEAEDSFTVSLPIFKHRAHSIARQIALGFAPGSILLTTHLKPEPTIADSLWSYTAPITEHVSFMVPHQNLLPKGERYLTDKVAIFSGGVFYGYFSQIHQIQRFNQIHECAPNLANLIEGKNDVDHASNTLGLIVLDVPVGELIFPISRDSFTRCPENAATFEHYLSEADVAFVQMATQGFDYQLSVTEFYERYSVKNKRLAYPGTNNFNQWAHHLTDCAFAADEPINAKRLLGGALRSANRVERLNLSTLHLDRLIGSEKPTMRFVSTNGGLSYPMSKYIFANNTLQKGKDIILVKDDEDALVRLENSKTLQKHLMRFKEAHGYKSIISIKGQLPRGIKKEDFKLYSPNFNQLLDEAREFSLGIIREEKPTVDLPELVESITLIHKGETNAHYNLSVERACELISEAHAPRAKYLTVPSSKKVDHRFNILSYSFPLVIIKAKKTTIEKLGVKTQSYKPYLEKIEDYVSKLPKKYQQYIIDASTLHSYMDVSDRSIHHVIEEYATGTSKAHRRLRQVLDARWWCLDQGIDPRDYEEVCRQANLQSFESEEYLSALPITKDALDRILNNATRNDARYYQSYTRTAIEQLIASL